MGPRRSIFVALFFLCLLAGCSAKRDLIILLPDPDGKIGAIRVTTRGGSQILDQSGYAVEVEDFNKPPVAPRPIAEGEITGVFGAALSAQPDVTGRFISFLLFFESDTSELIHESKVLLPEIVRTIRNRKRNEIYVVGYTDRVGTELYNLKLSSRRAYYVRDLLVSSGIKSSDIAVSFHGETMPLVNTEDEVAEPLNRRVEVIAR
ncbi:MAG TPA: OmpA family protein [Thermodesulfobacteriota bacterium]|nr:OmpA family protein [Thermodesulfobacteriota bacterium]